jgi:hypothetical protein
VCHQTVSLAQAAIEERGIPTASITMLPEITRRLRPPRALDVPFPLGFPLGAPNDPEGQRAVLSALLALADRPDVPVLEDYPTP